MKVMEAGFAKGFIRLCDDGFRMNWHERNGGNLSYRMKQEEVAAVAEDLSKESPWLPIKTTVKELAGEFFMVSGSGKFMRNMILDPKANACIIEVDGEGKSYRICWGLGEGERPTSELPTHLMNHEIKKRLTSGRYRVIYHAHPTNLIALTFVLPLTDADFTRELWEMATECPVVFPGGIGVVPWMVPGGRAIAVETSRLMADYDAVVWAHHGLFCAGEDFDLTYGLMHTVEKSAEILVKVRSMTDTKRQTITPAQFRELAVDFGVSLPEKFLFEKK